MTWLPPFVTSALVLKQVATGEADFVVTLLTQDRGKLVAIAKAARKSRRRFGAALAPFVLSEATLRERTGTELYWLDTLQMVREFSVLGSDVVKLAHASYATELITELTALEQRDPSIMALLVALYEVVAAYPPRAEILRAFELKLLGKLGFHMALEHCVRCQSGYPIDDEPEDLRFSVHHGGLLCGSCSQHPQVRAHVVLFSQMLRRYLWNLNRLDTLEHAADSPTGARDIVIAARQINHQFLAQHLSRPLKSLAFLEQL